MRCRWSQLRRPFSCWQDTYVPEHPRCVRRTESRTAGRRNRKKVRSRWRWSRWSSWIRYWWTDGQAGRQQARRPACRRFWPVHLWLRVLRFRWQWSGAWSLQGKGSGRPCSASVPTRNRFFSAWQRRFAITAAMWSRSTPCRRLARRCLSFSERRRICGRISGGSITGNLKGQRRRRW